MPARPLPPIGFWSYARPDDELSGGQLSRLRALIRAELQQQYGRAQIQLFQDVSAISHGSRWEGEIRRALDNSTFFIPILSPSFVQSEWCVQEFRIFQDRQQRLFDLYPDLPRTSRIFPIHYIDVMEVEGLDPAVDASLRELQWFDFREFRHSDFGGADVRRTVSSFVTSVRDLLRLRVEQAEEPAPIPPPAAPVSAPPVSVPTPAAPPPPFQPPPAYPPSPPPAGPNRAVLIAGGLLALAVIVGLILFLSLRTGPTEQASAPAAAPVAAPAATPATAPAATAPAPAAAQPVPDTVWREAVVGRWGDNPGCSGRIARINADGTFFDQVSGSWSIQNGIVTFVEPSGTRRASLDIAGAEGEVLTLVEIGTGQAETWYSCPGP